MANDVLKFINNYGFVFAQFVTLSFAASKTFSFAKELSRKVAYLALSTMLLFGLFQLKFMKGGELFNFIKLFVIILLTFFLWKLIFDNKMGEICFFTLMFYYEMMLSDLFTGNIAVILLKNNVLAIFDSSHINQFIISLMSLVCFIFIISLTIKYFENKDLEIPKKYWVAVNAILMFCFAISLLFMNYNASFSSQKLSISVLFVWFGFAIISFFIVKMFTDLCFYFQAEKKELIEQISIQALHDQLDMQEKAMQTMQKSGHDMKNNLNNINTLLLQTQIVEAREYIKMLCEQIDESKAVTYCKNHTINSILNYKKNKCEERGIRLKLLVDISFDSAVSPIDLTSALANLLDNAIECVEQLEPDKRIIEVSIGKYKLYDSFIVVNEYVKEIRLSRGNYITSKADITLHGYGLKLIQSVAEKYHGTLQVETKNHQFRATLLLYTTAP